MEIYNEDINHLLAPEHRKLQINESEKAFKISVQYSLSSHIISIHLQFTSLFIQSMEHMLFWLFMPEMAYLDDFHYTGASPTRVHSCSCANVPLRTLLKNHILKMDHN